ELRPGHLGIQALHVKAVARQLELAGLRVPPEQEKIAPVHGSSLDRRWSGIGGQARPDKSTSVRRTTPFVSGTLYAFLARGRAPATAVSAAFTASSGVIRWPASRRSTSGSRQGM